MVIQEIVQAFSSFQTWWQTSRLFECKPAAVLMEPLSKKQTNKKLLFSVSWHWSSSCKKNHSSTIPVPSYNSRHFLYYTLGRVLVFEHELYWSIVGVSLVARQEGRGVWNRKIHDGANRMHPVYSRSEVSVLSHLFQRGPSRAGRTETSVQ